MVASVVSILPGMPRLLQWMCSGCGTPSSCTARASARRMRRGVTPCCGPGSSMSSPRTLNLNALMPPGLTVLTAERRGRAHHPGDVVVDPLLSRAVGEPLQQQLVIAEHDIGALVDESAGRPFRDASARVRGTIAGSKAAV